MAVMTQRYLLQAMYVDRLLGELIDRLEATSIFDDALMVVVADHGVSLEPGTGLRGPADGAGTTRHGVQAVPLFVKFPGQLEGATDDRPTQIVDVLPTIADAIDLDLPDDWELDGRSLLADPADPEPRRWLDGQLTSELNPELFGAHVRSSIVDLPNRSDFVGVGPYGSLIGRAATDLEITPSSGLTVRLDNPDAYEDVAETALLPALFTATTDGLTGDDWIAVVVDGTIAGVGPVYDDDGEKVVALLDPRTLGAGAHEVRVFVVGGDGSSLEELSITK
jgi:hypothetical protein